MKNIINKIKQHFEKPIKESRKISHEEGLDIIEKFPPGGEYILSYFTVMLPSRPPKKISKQDLIDTYKSFMEEDSLFNKKYFKGNLTEEKFSYKTHGKMSCINDLLPKEGPWKDFPHDAECFQLYYTIYHDKKSFQ